MSRFNRPNWKPRRLDQWSLYAQRRNRHRRAVSDGVAALFVYGRNGAAHDWSQHGKSIAVDWLFDGDRDGAAHDFSSHNGGA